MTIHAAVVEWSIRTGRLPDDGVRETWPLFWIAAAVSLVVIAIGYHHQHSNEGKNK